MTPMIEVIKRLREETHAGVQDCRKALEETNNNFTAAAELLRQKAAQNAARRTDHAANQGLIELYSHADRRIGVMVEVNTETDYAARSQVFRSFAHEIALQIAASAPEFVRDEEIPTCVLEEQRQKVLETIDLSSKPEALQKKILDGYLQKYKNKAVLLRQPYIRDDTLTVAQLLAQTIAQTGENVMIRRFQRWELNDGFVEQLA